MASRKTAVVEPVDVESTVDDVLKHPWNVIHTAYTVKDGVASLVDVFYEHFDHKDASAEYLIEVMDWVKEDVKLSAESTVGTTPYAWIVARVETGATLADSKVDRLMQYEFPPEVQRQIKARPQAWLFDLPKDAVKATRRVRKGATSDADAPVPQRAAKRVQAARKDKVASKRGVTVGTGPVVKSGGLAGARRARAAAAKAKAS